MILLNKDVYDYIKNADNDILDVLSTQINRRRSALQEEIIWDFMEGENVEFSTKQGLVIKGVIEKKNRKTILVKTDEGKWKVSPSLLRKA